MMRRPHTFIGIDLSTAPLDTASRPSGSAAHVANTEDGITACVTWVSAQTPERIVVEATGGWERALVAALLLAQMSVAVINPRQGHEVANATGQLAKTDRLEAAMLAQFGEAVRPTPRPAKPEALQDGEALGLRRRQLVTRRTMDAQRVATARHRVQASLTPG